MKSKSDKYTVTGNVKEVKNITKTIILTSKELKLSDLENTIPSLIVGGDRITVKIRELEVK